MQTVKSKVATSIPLLEKNIFFHEEGIKECHFLSQFGEITKCLNLSTSLLAAFSFFAQPYEIITLTFCAAIPVWQFAGGTS